MRRATRIVAASFGIVAGLAGLEHGYYEILQGNSQPASVLFPSMGSPCVPQEIWNACEPAMSIIPNFLISGILSVIIGLLILVWSGAFVQRKQGGLVLILLSITLLLVGGGIVPPLIGIVGGIAGTKINTPVTGKPPSGLLRFSAKLWPWPLVIFLVWVLGQFPVGYFFNDFLGGIMGFVLPLILVTLPLSVYTGYARDVVG